MEITVHIRRLNYKRKATTKIITHMINEGWSISSSTRTLFVTHYSFSKII